jgi:hypothetical protein
MRAALLATLALAACGDDGGSTTPTDGGGSGSDVPACATLTACTTDNDCAVEPGTRCNTALPIPRCQPLACGTAGSKCAEPAFCTDGLSCFDSTHFGESTTIYAAGRCTAGGEIRQACTTRCMQAWTASMTTALYPCSQQQATALCADVCAKYPAWDVCESYFERYNANDFRFGYVNCEMAPLCPSIGVHCGTQDTNLEHCN